MENTLLLLQSLTGKPFEMLNRALPEMKGTRFLLFQNFQESADAAGCGENYRAFTDRLNQLSIPTETLPEYSLDEFLFNHRAKGFEEKPLYLTHVPFFSLITASNEVLGYNGELFLYNMSPMMEASRMAPYKNAFHCKRSAGERALDNSPVNYSHVVGSICHFSVDGVTYQQVLKGRSAVKDAGAEGYTMLCEENPSYRVKIWDCASRTRSDLEKIEKMFRLSQGCPYVCLPLAFVYNDHDHPIGIVMNEFKGGELIPFRKWRELECPLIYVKQLLVGLIWMEANSLLHRDFNHNILVNQAEKALCIIDTDSIQFGNYRASSYSNLDKNGLPMEYEKYSNNAFFNTVEISYSALAILLSIFVDVEKLVGPWDDETGFVSLYPDALKKLKEKSVSLAILAEEAFTMGKSASLEKQLALVNALLEGKELLQPEPKTVVVEPVPPHHTEYPAPSSLDKDSFLENEDDDPRGDVPVERGGFRPPIPNVENRDESLLTGQKDRASAQPDKEQPLRESVPPFPGMKKPAFTVDPIMDPDAAEHTKKDRRHLKLASLSEMLQTMGIRTFLIHLLVKMFATGTVVENLSEEDILRNAMKGADFKRKVLGTAATAVLIIAMLICIRFM